MMCNDYGIGGSYLPHIDFNGEGDQRFATVVTFIETPVAGGATVFPYIDVSVFAEKGSGLFWYNLSRSSAIDFLVVHKACPVLFGSKWICNKWIGYDSQWHIPTKQCGLSYDAKLLEYLRENSVHSGTPHNIDR